MPDAYHFDADTHTYWCGARRLASVTEVISPLVDYSMVPEERLEFARDRGTAVHLACHYDDMDDLHESSVSPLVLPFLTAWRKFKRDFDVEIVMSEEPLFNPALGVAGTPDKVLIAYATTTPFKVLGDIKTVVEMKPVIGVQLSGYEMLVDKAKGISVKERWGIQLRKDGTYRRHSYPFELPTFMSLLTLHNWRQRFAA